MKIKTLTLTLMISLATLFFFNQINSQERVRQMDIELKKLEEAEKKRKKAAKRYNGKYIYEKCKYDCPDYIKVCERYKFGYYGCRGFTEAVIEAARSSRGDFTSTVLRCELLCYYFSSPNTNRNWRNLAIILRKYGWTNAAVKTLFGNDTNISAETFYHKIGSIKVYNMTSEKGLWQTAKEFIVVDEYKPVK